MPMEWMNEITVVFLIYFCEEIPYMFILVDVISKFCIAKFIILGLQLMFAT
jgi:hypothetical protein